MTKASGFRDEDEVITFGGMFNIVQLEYITLKNRFNCETTPRTQQLHIETVFLRVIEHHIRELIQQRRGETLHVRVPVAVSVQS